MITAQLCESTKNHSTVDFTEVNFMLCEYLGKVIIFLKNCVSILGRLDGSVGSASDFGSGHDLVVHEFESRIGLTAVGQSFFGSSVPLSLCPSSARVLSVSKVNIFLKNKKKKSMSISWRKEHNGKIYSKS